MFFFTLDTDEFLNSAVSWIPVFYGLFFNRFFFFHGYFQFPHGTVADRLAFVTAVAIIVDGRLGGVEHTVTTHLCLIGYIFLAIAS